MTNEDRQQLFAPIACPDHVIAARDLGKPRLIFRPTEMAGISLAALCQRPDLLSAAPVSRHTQSAR